MHIIFTTMDSVCQGVFATKIGKTEEGNLILISSFLFVIFNLLFLSYRIVPGKNKRFIKVMERLRGAFVPGYIVKAFFLTIFDAKRAFLLVTMSKTITRIVGCTDAALT